MSPDVSYTPYAKFSKKKTGDIIMFVQFEEGNYLSEMQKFSLMEVLTIMLLGI